MAMQITTIFATRAIRRQEKRYVSSSSLSAFCFLKPSIACEQELKRSPWQGGRLLVRFFIILQDTYLKRTLRPAADEALYEIIDAAALLALFDGCDKVFIPKYEFIVSFFQRSVLAHPVVHVPVISRWSRA